MDMADMAFNAEQDNLRYSINKVKKQKHDRIKPEGYCHSCFNDLEDSKRLFCGPKCAEQYERAIKLRN